MVDQAGSGRGRGFLRRRQSDVAHAKVTVGNAEFKAARIAGGAQIGKRFLKLPDLRF